MDVNMSTSEPKSHKKIFISKSESQLKSLRRDSAIAQFTNDTRINLMHRTKTGLTSLVHSPSTIMENPFQSRTSIPRAQIAEIQLAAILNDPVAAWPLPIRAGNDSPVRNKPFTIEEVSNMLNTQQYMIKRLVHALNMIGENNEEPTLTDTAVRKLTRALNSTMDVRALLLFKVLGGNNEYYLTRESFMQFFEEYLSKIPTFSVDQRAEVCALLLQKFHFDKKTQIDFEEFYEIILHDQTLLESLSQFCVDPEWFIYIATPKIEPTFSQRCCNRLCSRESYQKRRRIFTKAYLHNNMLRIIAWILYILVNIALIIYAAVHQTIDLNAHAFVVIARIGGMLLNFNCAFVIFLMLKRTILIIRSIKLLRKFIPVDDHIDFHRIVGRVIALVAIMHTIAHMLNFGRLSRSKRLPSNFTWWEYMFTTRPGTGWVGGFASISGIILLVILVVMVIFSMQWIRRSGRFQIFYWTHLLYWPFFVFLIIHAQNFWKWVIFPLTIFIIEKFYSFISRYSSSAGRSYVKSATIEQSNVIRLTMHRPRYFSFRPGDYICINLPRVTLYEFHPFTISSAPEDGDFLTVHIQAIGNWTKSVYQHFKSMSEAEQQVRQIKVYRADLNPTQTSGGYRNSAEAATEPREDVEGLSEYRERVIINGPYSSCARYVFDCKHVVLIGGGIGITPYASILSSLMAQFRASRTICKRCQCVNYDKRTLTENGKLTKVDFIWVNRDHKSFEWFLNLLCQFEEEQEAFLASNPEDSRFLDIHLFFTQIKHDENIGNVPLDIVTKIWAQVAGKDIFTNLRTKTKTGRPNWEELFNQLISGENRSTANDVNVFFCGPNIMGDTIREYCHKFRFRFFKEEF